MIQASSASQRQELWASLEEMDSAPPEEASRWVVISELRERPGTGQRLIFLVRWVLAGTQEPSVEQSEALVTSAGAEGSTGAPGQDGLTLLPPIEILRVVAERWRRVVGAESEQQPALLAFRVPAALSPQEVAEWCPSATVRLYTLGGLVPPLPDTMLAEEPLARYSVVRAPNMSFWPQLRALIEEQEREQPGMDRWENLEHDLALLEQELAFWLVSPHGLIVNLYEGEDLVGHLSLARQRDETEGCDGWGILALHIARRARGQYLSVLLQRIAATLILSSRMERQATQMLQAIRPVADSATDAAEAADTTVEESSAADEAPPAQAAHSTNEGAASDGVTSALSDEGDQGGPVANMLEQPWPYLFGFIPPNNIPALRGAYAAGREIIGTYVDVPMAALVEDKGKEAP